MIKILKKLHLYGIWLKFCMFCVNKIFKGAKFFAIKRMLLNAAGYKVGKNSKIVSPIIINGSLRIGENCWIGKNFIINGNAMVMIGDNCDIAPEVICNTGGHEIGSNFRRAGMGECKDIIIGKGCWICARSTILRGVKIGDGCVVAACACVVRDVPDNVLIGGVPAKIIRELDNE